MTTEITLFDRIMDHMAAAMVFDLGRYLIAATLITIIMMVARRWSEVRRIQKRRAQWKDYWREFSSSLRTVVVFALTTISTVLMIDAGWVQFYDGGSNWVIFAVQLIAMTVAHDAYFYWMHRGLHLKPMFRFSHLHHHKSHTPTPWAAYSFSTFEAFAEAAFVPAYLVITSTLFGPIDSFMVFVFLAHMIFRNVLGHSGVEFFPSGWTRSKWVGWITAVTHHDLHHSQGRSNFGLYFTWWDRWMGTEHPQYHEKFEQAAKPLTRAVNGIVSQH